MRRGISLNACVTAWRRCEARGPAFELILVDDGSADGLRGASRLRLPQEMRTVYVVANRKDRSVPDAFGAPVEVVAGNRKRTHYFNLPREASR